MLRCITMASSIDTLNYFNVSILEAHTDFGIHTRYSLNNLFRYLAHVMEITGFHKRTSVIQSQTYNWALLHIDTFTPVLFASVSERAGTFKYRDKSIGKSSTYFLNLLQYRYITHEILFHVLQ